MVFLAASVLAAASAFGEPITGRGDFIIAIDEDGIVGGGSYPAAEAPPNVLDGDPGITYLNFVAAGSGFIVTPQAPFAVQSFTITTADEARPTALTPTPSPSTSTSARHSPASS